MDFFWFVRELEDEVFFVLYIPSRELTYPALGSSENHLQKCRLGWNMLIPCRVNLPPEKPRSSWVCPGCAPWNFRIKIQFFQLIASAPGGKTAANLTNDERSRRLFDQSYGCLIGWFSPNLYGSEMVWKWLEITMKPSCHKLVNWLFRVAGVYMYSNCVSRRDQCMNLKRNMIIYETSMKGIKQNISIHN